MQQQAPILIIGKNAKTGARVNRRLQALGHATRAVSRSTTPSFDWENPTTWADAIRGTRRAYVTYQPDLAVPNAQAAIKSFVQIARENGLEHIVLLSGRGEEGAQRAEKLLQESGIAWTIVRCSWFCQNFSESFMLEGILTGELVVPETDVVEPFVDADDIADVVVTALTQPGHQNRLYELTGPQAINFAQCAKEISDALGRQVNHIPVSIDAYIDAMSKQGQPRELQWLIHELFTVVFDGRNSQVKHGIEEALGRPATDFKTYVEKALASGVWNSTQQKKYA